ncbi:LacI family DNA-binding transcriptional regulator [Streptomyces sp. MI02-7b]|uniref:LacI family DNA-binding transcriptional regulator n=1 Tax=Streptomyces sp. MI02-7b TaxID=462941 RepID=UPI0029B14C78|nr:LacI family DNA-binding transcriptional regulator [Streptomyces sp. MI02-7b]MDX3077083.1 LacI family DNA-binding transcriptional regulator [Streptomyces sp. MI02-7b]
MATIKDVAARAGVAPSTVSYVLSGSRKISEDTRRAVRQAIDELGYHPRASARTLRSTRTQVLALALPRVAGGYRAVDGRFAIGISDAARAHGYDVLLTTAREGVPGLRRIAGGRQADAAILMAVEMEDPRIEALRELAFPTALLGRSADDTQPWTDLDWEAATALAVRTVVAAGHRDVAFLATTDHELRARRGYAVRGVAGARRAAAETGADVAVRESTGDIPRLPQVLRALLCGERPPTALVVQHVAALPHILGAVTAEGLRVPEDLSVVAVGNLPDDVGGHELPRIELPVEEMSAEVVRLAVETIDAHAQGVPAGLASGGRLIAPVLLARERVAPPHPRPRPAGR